MKIIKALGVGLVVSGALAVPSSLRAHHEAIFGPQSATLITKNRYVSSQYYLTNEGRRPAPEGHSHIGVLSVGTALGERWGVAATLPIEAERGEEESATGVQDVVLGVRFFPVPESERGLMTVFTVEPPTGSLEHRAVGLGGGAVYGREKGAWSGLVYVLGRTESSLDEGEKRGDRLFLGGGVAYETHDLPFSPQLGLSWEKTGREQRDGVRVAGSESSVVMLHPTVSKTFGESESVQGFVVVSVPVAQWSGLEGWQRWRIAAGMVWSF